MRRVEYSYTSARFALLFFVLVLGGAAIGQAIRPGTAAGIGAGIGVGVLLALMVRDVRIRRRGNDWVRVGRSLGFKSLYSGHMPALPFEESEEMAHLLWATTPKGTLYIGDRMERLLVTRRTRESGADVSVTFSDPEATEPLIVETIFVLHLPGLRLPPLAAGKSRGLGGRGDEPRLPSHGLHGVGQWLRRHPGWRVEMNGEFVRASRPRKVCPIDRLPEVHAAAVALLERVPNPTVDG